ncbi:hypothetical protein MJD09_20900 [bacterium]|nr:hypothetical protein [bacterium]
MKKQTNVLSSLLLAVTICLFGCSEDFADNPKGNQPPNTFVTFFSSNQLNPITSKVTLTWWGDDPDGVVVGFIYTFDPDAPSVQTWSATAPDPNWTFTENTQETFVLTLTGTDTTYSLWVKAIDDQGAADTDGATQNFSVINSPPKVEFVATTEVPDTTFTVATFIWTASDLDGNDTIARFQYALDDTTNPSNWRDLPAGQTSVTLTASDGLTEGEHVFFLRAEDVAGAISDVILMPSSEDEVWYVREPSSTVLLVDDYNVSDGTDIFFRTTVESVVGPVNVWDIKRNSGELDPPSVAAFTGTLLLFDTVIWYADTGPNLAKAQISVPEYIDQGGKILLTTSFREFTTNEGDPVLFSPADSLDTRIGRLLRSQDVLPSQSYADLGFPILEVGVSIIPNVFPLIPKVSSEVMYRLPESNSWEGTPAVGVIDRNDSFIFFSLPLASLNNLNTVPLLFEKILNEVF